MHGSVMQVRCAATLHRSLVKPILRPRTPYGRSSRRSLAVPLQARKTETSNNDSKDITETGGKVRIALDACDMHSPVEPRYQYGCGVPYLIIPCCG